MHTVIPATPYRPVSLGSMGDAHLMIVRQFQFPHHYDENEEIGTLDHDRMMQQEYEHATRCIKKYTGSGELILENWFENSSDEKIMNFIKEYTKADTSIQWTGYRILGSVHRGNGSAVWSLQLFAKNPKSSTKVYTGRKAPNVLLN